MCDKRDDAVWEEYRAIIGAVAWKGLWNYGIGTSYATITTRSYNSETWKLITSGYRVFYYAGQSCSEGFWEDNYLNGDAIRILMGDHELVFMAGTF